LLFSLLVADTFNHRLRRVTPQGTISTVAGGPGFANGVGTAAHFNHPWGIVVDGHCTICVSDYGNHCIRKVTPADWMVSTLCGRQAEGCADGAAAAARFYPPRGLALDMHDNIIGTDSDNHCIRKVALSNWRVSTLTGSRAGDAAEKGFADSEAAAARFNHPHAVAVDGNNTILVTDHSNQRLQKIAGEGALVMTLAGSGMGAVDGEGASARFTFPQAMVIDERGRLLVADTNNSLRMV